MSIFFSIFFFLLFNHFQCSTTSNNPHIINFHSPSLYPPDLTYDPSTHHFLVGSLRHRTISSVSHSAAVQTLISDHSLPPNATILGMAIDTPNHRLLAVVNSMDPLPPFHALAAYDLPSRRRLFLSLLPDGGSANRPIPNDMAVDNNGNAYVTNSAGNFIWKVDFSGEATVFSRSPQFTRFPADMSSPFSFCGLNGIAYVSNGGYLLVVQSNTGKMFKVDLEDGAARLVVLPEDLTLADAVAVRNDGVVLVVSQTTLWFLRSDDNWGKGMVIDKITLDEERFPTSVVVGKEERAYVLYSGVWEGIVGSGKREWFSIEEIKSGKDNPLNELSRVEL